MPSLNVHIHAFGDLDMAIDAIDSVPADIPVYVLDGRYANFEGDTVLTPRLEAACEDRDNCEYHAPPEGLLPFGHDSTAPPEWRAPIHAKAVWANRDVLPPAEWTLKLDTDERLQSFDIDLDELDARGKYAPKILRPDDPNGDPHITRLWQPRYWTAWIDDCLLPRSAFPRSLDLETLSTIWLGEEFRTARFFRRYVTNDIVIENRGHERPADYQKRRLMHLEAIGRSDRAAELRESG